MLLSARSQEGRAPLEACPEPNLVTRSSTARGSVFLRISIIHCHSRKLGLFIPSCSFFLSTA